MIRLQHNGTALEATPEGFANLAALVRAYIAEPGSEDRVIEHLSVDGRVIEVDGIETLEEVSLDGVREVELRTRGVLEVARESLDSSADYAGLVRDALSETAQLLRAGRIEDGNRLFADVLDALNVLVFAVTSAGRVLRADAELLHELEPELRPWLEAASDALEQRDWLRLADTLEYELRPRLAEWPERIRSLRAGAGSASNPHG